jgi:hypothetical protein
LIESKIAFVIVVVGICSWYTGKQELAKRTRCRVEPGRIMDSSRSLSYIE